MPISQSEAEALITRNAQLEKQLQERTIQFEMASKELETFCYSVSHDLRSPLRGVDGWSLALQEDYGAELDEQATIYLDRIRSEAKRMNMLIEALLKLSRLSKKEFNPQLLDISLLAGQIMAKLQAEQPERQIKLGIQPNLQVLADASLLEIALTNLFHNAWKFSGTRELAEIDFGQTIIDGQRVFYLRDNGTGFNMAFAGKLFGAFQRMHKDSDFPGAGIGLAMVQRIILRHGGKIWAETEPDKGATFYWTFGSDTNE